MAPEGSGLGSVIAGVGLIVSGIVAVPVAPLGSNTENAGVRFPEAVGVPARRPVESMDIPPGKPIADQVGGPESPMAWRVVLGYGLFTVEAGRLVVVIRGAIVSPKPFVLKATVAELSATWTVKLETVAVFTVPERTPLGASVRPPGNCESTTIQVYGAVPPEAVSVKE
jgi:hypothetical protein